MLKKQRLKRKPLKNQSKPGDYNVDENAKRFMLDTLRTDYIEFMTKCSKIPGAMVQKQQAFMRFDEGHMWMQNAIVSYVDEAVESLPKGTPDSVLPTMDNVEIVDETPYFDTTQPVVEVHEGF